MHANHVVESASQAAAATLAEVRVRGPNAEKNAWVRRRIPLVWLQIEFWKHGPVRASPLPQVAATDIRIFILPATGWFACDPEMPLFTLARAER